MRELLPRQKNPPNNPTDSREGVNATLKIGFSQIIGMIQFSKLFSPITEEFATAIFAEIISNCWFTSSSPAGIIVRIDVIWRDRQGGCPSFLRPPVRNEPLVL
jgi:hypothetical protein